MKAVNKIILLTFFNFISLHCLAKQTIINGDTINFDKDSINWSSLAGRYDSIDFLEIEDASFVPTSGFTTVGDSLLLLNNLSNLSIETLQHLALTPNINKLTKLKEVVIYGKLGAITNLTLQGSANALNFLFLRCWGSSLVLPKDMSIFKNLKRVIIECPDMERIAVDQVLTFFKQLSKLQHIEGYSFYVPHINKKQLRNIEIQLKEQSLDYIITVNKEAPEF